MKLFRSKRGISPLFATIILIVFAVSIGALLMGWSSKSINAEEKLPVMPIYSIACADNLVKQCCDNKETSLAPAEIKNNFYEIYETPKGYAGQHEL